MDWPRDLPNWPNAALSRLVPNRPHRWHVQESGTGPLILLIHGAGGATHSWRDILPDLARNFHVVALDLPGQGFTALGSRQRCGLEMMAEDIASFAPHRAGSPMRSSAIPPVPPLPCACRSACTRRKEKPPW